MRILDVGQCGIDGPAMKARFERDLGATVDQADTRDEAVAMLRSGRYDLVLVNRVLHEDGSSGLEVVDAVVRSGSDTPVMLVSDRADAQREAVAKGARPGFGKSALGEAETLELIRSAAG